MATILGTREGEFYLTTTEGYGGTCPNCGYTKMLYRYGSSGWYQFDACPNCGFACGYGDGSKGAEVGWDVWQAVLKANGFEPIQRNMPKLKEVIDRLPEPIPLEKELKSSTVWDYNNPNSPTITVAKIMKVVERQGFMKEIVQFT